MPAWAWPAGVVLLGAPVGLLWSVLAPRPDVVATAGGGIDFVDAETKDFIAADAYLFLLLLVAGALTAVVVWRLVPRRGLPTVVGLVLAGGLAAWLASRTGVLGGDRRALVAAARAGRLSRPADLPLELHARAVLLGWPGAAAAVYAVLLWRSPREPSSEEPDDRADAPAGEVPARRPYWPWARLAPGRDG